METKHSKITSMIHQLWLALHSLCTTSSIISSLVPNGVMFLPCEKQTCWRSSLFNITLWDLDGICHLVVKEKILNFKHFKYFLLCLKYFASVTQVSAN